jgi:hypothetical protein
MCLGGIKKSIIKDIKDGRKDFIKDKDKELRKDFVKDKELRKDFIKDKELQKDVIKDKELRKDVIKDKEIVLDNKPIKDIQDNPPKRIGDNFPGPGPVENPVFPGPVENPVLPGAGGGAARGAGSPLENRLAAMEAQLGALTSFISADLRPDLSTGAFSGEPDLSQEDLESLRDELAQQAADAAAVKADFDTPWT